MYVRCARKPSIEFPPSFPIEKPIPASNPIDVTYALRLSIKKVMFHYYLIMFVCIIYFIILYNINLGNLDNYEFQVS
nr:unnamed protein product [Callosobruchus chinensis]